MEDISLIISGCSVLFSGIVSCKEKGPRLAVMIHSIWTVIVSTTFQGKNPQGTMIAVSYTI